MTDELSIKQKIANFLRKNDLFMNLKFVENFVGKQLNILPEATQSVKQQNIIYDKKSSHRNFVQSLNNYDTRQNIQNIDGGYWLQILKDSPLDKHQKLAEKIQEILQYEYEIMKNQDNDKLFMEKQDKYIGRPIQVDENHYIYLNTVTEDNKMFPYFICYPKDMKENLEIIVDTLNTREGEYTNNRASVFAEAVNNGMLYTTIDNVPMLAIYVPNEENEPYYQQLSRECFTDENRKYKRIDLQVKDTIIGAQKKLEGLTGKKVSDKIVLNGYSTSGIFAQRFALLHYEMIHKAIIGGAIGTIPIPTEDLDYPLRNKRL